MSIKFRCSYCRQFLGISRGRAGDVVDCPSCGRSIRVPGLDGVAAPVPSPEINLQDAKLARALDELAHWDSPQPVPVATEPEEEEIPQPIAEPIPIEVPVAPEPIAIKPPPSVEPLPTGSPSEQPAMAAEPAMSVAAALAELTQIPGGEPAHTATAPASYVETRQRPKSSRLTTLVIAALLALGAFAAGYFASPSRRMTTLPKERGELDANAATVSTAAPAISGRITYKTAEGESLPDRGARVLVLPREREGTAKLSAVGLRAADHPADVRLATAALRSLGGDLATTDDGGKFSLQLANPGTFQIIVISNYATRAGDDEIDPELIRQLTPYFDHPAQVLGRTKVHFGQVRYKGTGTEGWDHSF